MARKGGAKRRWIVILLVGVLFVIAGLVFKFVRITPVYPEYNIVLITIDTTRADRLGCYGLESARTPIVDMLASQGVRFSNCYSTGPITLPAHTSLMTGLYPFRHGLRDNNAGRLSDQAVTLPEILKKADYQTGAIVGAYVLDSRFGLEQGFDYYDDDLGRSERDSQFHIPERKAGVVTASALEWLDQVQDSKFFLWAHYFDPHANYAPPGIDLTGPITPERTRQLYDLEIAYADAQMGRIVERVGKIQASTGRPTLIVVTSDHGESLGDHGEPTHGMAVYNDTIRTPLVIFDSTERDRGVVIEQPVSLVDIMPTLLKRLGLSLPYEIDGRLLPRSSADSKPGSNERPIYFESMMTYNVYGWSPLEGVIQGRNKLIMAPQPEFYDLKEDSLEARNLYEDGLPRLESLRSALEDLKDKPLESPPLVIEEAPQDQNALRKLMSLGYVGNVTHSGEIPDDLPNPKDLMPLHREILSAQSLLANGRTDRAFEKLSWVILQDPNNKMCLSFIVNVLTTAEPALAPEKAVELLQQLVKMRPKSSGHALALGKAYLKADDMESALAAFEKAVELDANNADALNNYAWYSYKQGENLETANKRSQQAIDLQPEDAHIRHTSACILLALKRPNEAVDQLEAALAIDSHFAIAHYHLGVAHQELGADEEAMAALKRAIELANESPSKSPSQTTPEWLPDAEARLAQLRLS